MIFATAHSHRWLIWGIALLVIGTLHLLFRRFYARRSQAFHDARQDSAPGFTKRLYRRHDSSFYLAGEIGLGVVFVVLGAVLVIANL